MQRNKMKTPTAQCMYEDTIGNSFPTRIRIPEITKTLASASRVIKYKSSRHCDVCKSKRFGSFWIMIRKFLDTETISLMRESSLRSVWIHRCPWFIDWKPLWSWKRRVPSLKTRQTSPVNLFSKLVMDCANATADPRKPMLQAWLSITVSRSMGTLRAFTGEGGRQGSGLTWT